MRETSAEVGHSQDHFVDLNEMVRWLNLYFCLSRSLTYV
jgi:hypothetical protein